MISSKSILACLMLRDTYFHIFRMQNSKLQNKSYNYNYMYPTMIEHFNYNVMYDLSAMPGLGRQKSIHCQ